MSELDQLKKMMVKLNEQLDELRNQRPITIENVNLTYQFDLLKIDTIEGTLNIGVSPEGGKGVGMHIEEIDAPSTSSQTMKFSTLEEMRKFQDVQSKVQKTIREESGEWIKHSQSQYLCVIGDTYAKQMIEDVQAQMDERILYYLRDPELSVDVVYEKSVEDAKQALDWHVQAKKEAQEADELENRE